MKRISMSEKPEAIVYKSEAQVAHEMALQILFTIEKKSWSDVTRKQFLNAHSDAVTALRGAPNGAGFFDI